jgi:hypothetical protein
MNSMRCCVTVALIAGLAGSAASAEVITLRSGQVGGLPGVAGQADDIVTYLPNNPPGAAISASPFTAADFAGAASGPAAHVINAHPAWTPGISDPLARWINWGVDQQVDPTGAITGTGYGLPGSSLYAIPFFVTTAGAIGGNMNIEYAIDDVGGDWYAPYLGGNPNTLYINGVALPHQGGNYAASTFYSQFIPFTSGWNFLYIYQRDAGILVSGTIFSITIDVVVPSAGPAAVFGLGLLTAARRRR